MIELRNITVKHPHFTLAPQNLLVPTGSHTILMGPTGCGKTTLLEIIAGLRQPTTGQVLVDGIDVTQWPPALRGLGYVPQDAAIFRTMTVRENLAFGRKLRGQTTSVVPEWAAKLGLTSMLDEPAIHLSGGEAQRLALGRALAFQPRILLLDEPMNAVDDETRTQLVELLRQERAKRELTILHVTHDKSEAEIGDRVHRV
jgi:molybdate/tungstate transport system ATP-binding protein